MNTLYIDWKSCYGIKSLAHTFDFSGRNHTQLIYAPNGTMKSSFAYTFRDVAENKRGVKPKDRIRNIDSPNYKIEADGQPISPSSIFVVNAEEDDIDASNKFSYFLASKELRDRYNAILQELNEKKDTLMIKLAQISQSSDCETEILQAFGVNQSTSIFMCLDAIYPHLSQGNYIYTFKYNNIFDKKGDIKKFLAKHQTKLENYFSRYKTLLSKSKLFRTEGTYTFGTKEVSNLEGVLKDKNFFGVHHKIVLNDNTTISTYEELSGLIAEEEAKILEDEELKKTFDEITKAIDANVNLRLFKKELEHDPRLILELVDYEEFRKKIWYNYMSSDEVLPLATELNNLYKSKQVDLRDLLREAGSQQDRWEKIVNLYTNRFFVPFSVTIENQQDVILKQESAKLSFSIKDDGQEFHEDKNALRQILSRGELRAFYIMQILFEIEALKGNGQDNLIILDDIADSFDYQNKYAIIEYINDLHKDQSTNFYLIILTHNFDFYRTVASRLGLGHKQVWMAVRDEHGNISLKPGQYRKDLFTFMMNNCDNDKFFISLIPFIRNLVEYEKSVNDAEYMLLTSCLHWKDNTGSITEDDIWNLLIKYSSNSKLLNRSNKHEKIIDILFRTADSIENDHDLDPVAIENKIVLSIASRLKTEVFLKKAILSNGGTEAELTCSSNQLKVWTELYKTKVNDAQYNDLIEQVNMMTPEFIHLNSFMYEPLIDLSVNHLLALYKKCKALP